MILSTEELCTTCPQLLAFRAFLNVEKETIIKGGMANNVQIMYPSLDGIDAKVQKIATSQSWLAIFSTL